MASIYCSNANYLAKIFGAISKVRDEPKLRINKKLVIREFDFSHIMLVEYVSKKPIRVKGKDEVCVNLNELNKILKRAKRGEPIRLSVKRKKVKTNYCTKVEECVRKIVDEVGVEPTCTFRELAEQLKKERCPQCKEKRLYRWEKKLVISFPNTRREFMINTLEPDTEEPPKALFSFRARLKIKPKEFLDTLRDAKLVSDNIVLNGSYLEAKGDFGNYIKALRKNARRGVRASYSINVLEDIINANFDEAILRWDNDKPLLVEYKVGLKFYLAPRIETVLEET